MPFKDLYGCLRTIHESIVAIEGFTVGLSFEQFCADDKTLAAVERKLAVLSEAAVRLGDEGQTVCRVYRGVMSAESAIGCGISMIGLSRRRFG